jgi:hypothetical protein
MQTIPIYIFDYAIKERVQKQLNENDDLGYKKHPVTEADLKVPFTITPFYFKEDKVSGYWMDPEIDDESGKANDIIVFIGYQSFRCPYSKQLIELLNIILK